jgi:hypothetical protein
LARSIGPIDWVPAFPSAVRSVSYPPRNVDDEDVSRWDISWLKKNRPLLIIQVVGIPLVVAWFLFSYFQTHSPFVFVLLALLPVLVVVNIWMVNRRRERQADPAGRRDGRTGTVLAPKQVIQGGPYAVSGRWVGAANVPGDLGRMNATTPLAVLELSDGVLTLRLRPQLFARVFGARNLRVEPLGVEAIFPSKVRMRSPGIRMGLGVEAISTAKGRMRSPAICIRPSGEPPFYFLLGDRASILTTLAAAGFPVEWEEREYSPS